MSPPSKEGVAVLATWAQRPSTLASKADSPPHQQLSPSAVEKGAPGAGEHHYVTAGGALLPCHNGLRVE